VGAGNTCGPFFMFFAGAKPAERTILKNGQCNNYQSKKSVLFFVQDSGLMNKNECSIIETSRKEHT
jgi:hypothetical protein